MMHKMRMQDGRWPGLHAAVVLVDDATVRVATPADVVGRRVFGEVVMRPPLAEGEDVVWVDTDRRSGVLAPDPEPRPEFAGRFPFGLDVVVGAVVSEIPTEKLPVQLRVAAARAIQSGQVYYAWETEVPERHQSMTGTEVRVCRRKKHMVDLSPAILSLNLMCSVAVRDGGTPTQAHSTREEREIWCVRAERKREAQASEDDARLLARYEQHQRGEWSASHLSVAELTRARELWSSALRARVEASRAREAERERSIVVDDDRWEP